MPTCENPKNSPASGVRIRVNFRLYIGSFTGVFGVLYRSLTGSHGQLKGLYRRIRSLYRLFIGVSGFVYWKVWVFHGFSRTIERFVPARTVNLPVVYRRFGVCVLECVNNRLMVVRVLLWDMQVDLPTNTTLLYDGHGARTEYHVEEATNEAVCGDPEGGLNRNSRVPFAERNENVPLCKQCVHAIEAR